MTNDYLLVNATVINEGKRTEEDLLIQNGRIQSVGKATGQELVLDCQGKFVLPGLIDDQVHFRQPGLTHKADIAHESRAAVAGGTTSFMEMPNTVPPTLDLTQLESKYAIASECSACNYAFYLGASNDNLEAVKSLPVGVAAAVKIFMGSSTGNMLVDHPKVLEQIFQNAPTLIATHCENSSRISEREQQWRERFGDAVSFADHAIIRDHQACIDSTKVAIDLAKQYQAQLHVLHITTAEECQLFDQIPLSQKHITAEACVHHLTLNDGDYESMGALMKCNPAVKTETDRQAIASALASGAIDVVATDHAPHTWTEKQGNYWQVPSGLPLLQEQLPLLLELYHDGVLSLETIVQKASHNVAERFCVKERGFIREGYWADLAIVDINQPYQVTHANALSKCGWTPFDGRTLRSSVWATLVNGALVYHKGVIDPTVRGQRLAFGRQR